MKYVCELCGQIYDEDRGDAAHGIPAGTPFAQLPIHYTCSLCGSEKEAFAKAAAPSAAPGSTAVKPEPYAKYAEEYRESQR